MSNKKIFQALFILIALTMLGACSKSDSGLTPPTNPPGSNGRTVNMSGMTFSPGSLTVAKGTTVTFNNNDGASHTATADDNSFNTGTIAAGASAGITFNTAGSFPYHCNFHSGMTGTIVVNP